MGNLNERQFSHSAVDGHKHDYKLERTYQAKSRSADTPGHIISVDKCKTCGHVQEGVMR